MDENTLNPVKTGPVISIIGVGGGGSNTVDEIYSQFKDSGINFLVCNTDAQVLKTAKVPNRIVLGANSFRGLGAGGDPQVGKKAAEESIEQIKEAVKGSDLVFVSAGMGGGTGTGGAPVICKACKDMGALTVAIVTKPFNFEQRTKAEVAANGLSILKNCVDSYIVVSNDKLVLSSGDNGFLNCMKESDKVMSNAVKTIVDLVNIPGSINLDFADVKATLKNSGLAVIGFGEASGENRAVEAARKAVSSNLLEVSIRGAGKCLINVVLSPDVSMKEIETAVNSISNITGKTDSISFGARVDESLHDKIIVSAIATYFGADSEEEKKVNSPNVSTDEFKVTDNSNEAIILPNYIKNCLSGANVDSTGNDNTKKLQSLNDEKDALTERVDSLLQQVDSLTASIGEKNNEYTILNNKYSDLQTSFNELDTQFNILKHEKDETEARYEKLDAKSKEDRALIQNYEAEISQLNARLDDIEFSSKDNVKEASDLKQLYDKKCNEFNEQVQRAESYQNRLRLALDQIMLLKDNLNKSESDYSEKLESLSSENNKNSSEIDALRNEFDRLNVSYASLNEEHTNLLNEYDQLNQKYNETIQNSDSSIVELNDKLSSLNERNEVLSSQNIELNMKLDDANKEIEEKETSLKARIEELERINEESTDRINQLEAEKKEALMQKTDIESEAFEVRNELNEKESLLSDYHTLKIRNQSLEDENTTLKTLNESLQKQNDELITENIDASENKSKLEKLSIVNSDLQNQLNNLNEVKELNELLKEENEDLLKTIENLKSSSGTKESPEVVVEFVNSNAQNDENDVEKEEVKEDEHDEGIYEVHQEDYDSVNEEKDDDEKVEDFSSELFDKINNDN